jgi:hypothetical protein
VDKFPENERNFPVFWNAGRWIGQFLRANAVDSAGLVVGPKFAYSEYVVRLIWLHITMMVLWWVVARRK